MEKTQVFDDSGTNVGEVHRNQPEYDYNKTPKEPTGRVYPDHYHNHSHPGNHIYHLEY